MQAEPDGNSGVAVLKEDAAYAEHLPQGQSNTHAHAHAHRCTQKDEKIVVLADLVAQHIHCRCGRALHFLVDF